MSRLRRQKTTTVVAIAIATAVFVVSVAVPALGGPTALSAANLTQKVQRALKISKGAKKRSKAAKTIAEEALAKAGAGTGPTGPAGPAGPPGPKGDKGDTGTVDTSNFFTKSESDNRFLGTAAKASDADALDGKDSSEFLEATAKAADANALDGKDSSEFLGAAQVPDKVSQHSATGSVPAGGTSYVFAGCPSTAAKAIGGGAHWGSAGTYSLGESNTGIINSSNLVGTRQWVAVGTNDEAGALNLTVWVICANP